MGGNIKEKKKSWGYSLRAECLSNMSSAKAEREQVGTDVLLGVIADVRLGQKTLLKKLFLFMYMCVCTCAGAFEPESVWSPRNGVTVS